jgi:hypothetical protein
MSNKQFAQSFAWELLYGGARSQDLVKDFLRASAPHFAGRADLNRSQSEIEREQPFLARLSSQTADSTNRFAVFDLGMDCCRKFHCCLR